MCSPDPRTVLREQNMQSKGHFDVSSIQTILGASVVNISLGRRERDVSNVGFVMDHTRKRIILGSKESCIG